MTWEAIPCATHLELQHLGGRGRKNRGIKVIFGDIASSRRAWLQPQIPLAAPLQCLSYTSPTQGAIPMLSYSTSILPLTITSKLDFSSKITYGNCLVNSHHSLGQWEMDKYHYLIFWRWRPERMQRTTLTALPDQLGKTTEARTPLSYNPRGFNKWSKELFFIICPAQFMSWHSLLNLRNI